MTIPPLPSTSASILWPPDTTCVAAIRLAPGAAHSGVGAQQLVFPRRPWPRSSAPPFRI